MSHGARQLAQDMRRARVAAAAARSLGSALVELEELEALTDAEGQMTGEDMYSSVRSGTNRSPHGAAFEYDDHRARHREEVERRFAKRIAAAVRRFLTQESASRLVLVIEPRMLGVLRTELGSLPDGVTRIELAKDLSRDTPRHILEALEGSGALRATPA